MESSQPENGLVMDKMTVTKAHDVPDLESKICHNGTVKSASLEEDGDESGHSADHDSVPSKGNSPPQLSPISPASDGNAEDTQENNVEEISPLDDTEKPEDGQCSSAVEKNDSTDCNKVESEKDPSGNDAEKSEAKDDDKVEKMEESEVQETETLEPDKSHEPEEDPENNREQEVDNGGCEKMEEGGESEIKADVDVEAPVLNRESEELNTDTMEGSADEKKDNSLDVADTDCKLDQEHEDAETEKSERISIKEDVEKNSETQTEGELNSETETKMEEIKSDVEVVDNKIRKSSDIPPPIFEDITDSEDEEHLENIELELDDLIDPAELSKSSGSSDREKCDNNSVLGENGSFNSGIAETVNTDLKEENGKISMSRSISDSEIKSRTKDEAEEVERPKSSNAVIQDEPLREKIGEGNTYATEPSFTETSKAALNDTGRSRHVRKQKFTARKSGKPVAQLDKFNLKTINLHPIRNMTVDVSEIEGALDCGPLKDGVFGKPSEPSQSDDVNLDSVKGDTFPPSDSNLGSSSTKPVVGNKKKRRKNTYHFPGFKKKARKSRSDELESLGSSADSVSLSDGDFQEAEKDSALLGQDSNSSSQKAESALDILTKNAHLGFVKKPKSSLLPSSSSASSSLGNIVQSTSSSSPQTSTSSSRSSLGKGNSKMKSVLDMLHARSRQKAESEKKSAATTITTVSFTTSATTTTTTILVSPPPNKPIVEGVKRKGTPRKRREEVICLSDSEDSDDNKKLVVEGKRKRDSVEGSNTTSTPSQASPAPTPAKVKPNAVCGQSPVVMVVAQHSSAPGLRSLLPRHALVSPAGTAGNKIIQPPPGSVISPFPLISTLPMGAKALSLGSLPPGMTAVPITSFAGVSQQAMTFFTTVPASVGTAVPIPFSGANLVNISSPKQLVNNTSPKNSKTVSSSSLSSSGKLPSSKTSGPHNSDSLRALLVGKPCTFSRVTSATPTQLSSTPMLFQMITTSGANLVPISAQPVTLNPSSIVPGMLKPTSTMPSGKPNYSVIKPHPPNVPNGVSCLTPPKTPDTDSSSEVAVAASLSRPVAGQVEDSEVIPLCCCKINGANFAKLSSSVTYCQALDTVDNKVLGCCNKVTNSQLVRPGVKIPFMAVCEVHRKRLKLHQCCPGCGHFCTQGKFQQCRKEGKSSVHNFHKQCVFYRGGKYYCPHCGEETSQCEVELVLNEQKPEEAKVVPPRLSKRETERKTARIGSKNFVKSKSTNEPKAKPLTLPNNKVISIDSLPLGPEQIALTRLCRCASEDRPKKYRTLPKDLYTPASEGDVDKVFYLLVDGMDPNKRYENNEDQTAMHAAAVSGSLATVFLLEQFGAEIHAQDKNLRTPLMCAAETGNTKIVQFLIKAGAKVEDRGEDGMTSLHYAAKAGYIDIIQHILETDKLDVNIQDDGGWTPIIWATESQLVDVVKYLLTQGGDPNKKDNEENTGLHWAAFSGSLDIAEMFLDMGCEIDAINEHGDRPLHIAARLDHYDIVVLLLARGADVDTRNNKDETAVECCVNKNGQVWMALKVNQQLRSFAARRLIHPERLLERDITMGREKNPIACVNAEDSEPCPTDFLYVIENVETSPLNINYVITSLQSCRCKDDCSSMYCVCGRSSIKCWYDKYGRLLEEVNLLEPPLVFECNRACRCWVNCNNRVVQNGITCRLQMFRTNGRGWGVRTLMDIPKGTFVCEYIGELISDSEADRREDDSYLFDLDNKDGDTYCIDARKYGNISRFINHLCEPNLVPVKVFVEHQDLRFPRICLFSSREIAAYEELGFDYGEKFWMIKWKHFTCACKSTKCKYSSETIKKTLADYKLRYPDEQVDS